MITILGFNLFCYRLRLATDPRSLVEVNAIAIAD